MQPYPRLAYSGCAALVSRPLERPSWGEPSATIPSPLRLKHQVPVVCRRRHLSRRTEQAFGHKRRTLAGCPLWVGSCHALPQINISNQLIPEWPRCSTAQATRHRSSRLQRSADDRSSPPGSRRQSNYPRELSRARSTATHNSRTVLGWKFAASTPLARSHSFNFSTPASRRHESQSMIF